MLQQLAISCLPTLRKNAGISVLIKIEPWPLSILNPITLAELQEVAAKVTGAKVSDAIRFKNPFTSRVHVSSLPRLELERGGTGAPYL